MFVLLFYFVLCCSFFYFSLEGRYHTAATMVILKRGAMLQHLSHRRDPARCEDCNQLVQLQGPAAVDVEALE